ncbi:MAG: glycosyltransferase family 4 protein [Pricia sp.]|nr:glycosyltransferase family 4 protein [Pricia sp.]
MNTPALKKVIVVDLSLKQTSPAGSCVLSELIGLAPLYDIHVFSTAIDEVLEKQVSYHPVPVISFPLLLRYVLFSIKVRNQVNEFVKKIGPVLIQTTQGQYTNSQISYPHFCHTGYLKKYWKESKSTGLKRIMRKLNHKFNARMESKAFNRAEIIVVPSQGLRQEIVEFYPKHKDKIMVIPNPVAIEFFEKPIGFEGAQLRDELGIAKNDLVISFVALGDFARKGLPELMKALNEDTLKDKFFKIVVAGGKAQEIRTYRQMSKDLGIENKVIFVGFHTDIRPYLWISDLFSLPSLYEIFPLVCVQAAAAGLPLLVSQMHGVEEYFEDEKNGWLIERTPQSIAQVLNANSNNCYELDTMGKFASQSVKKYSHENFRKQWINLYNTLN